MKKIHEIQKELSVEIENYKRLHAESKNDDAAASLTKVKTLTGELNEAKAIDAAEKAAATNTFSDGEKKELQRFSFLKFVREVGESNLSGFEKEMSEEAIREAKGNSTTLNGYGIPYRVLAAKAAAGQNTTTNADGGVLVEHAPITYLDLLQNKLVLLQLGATFMTGLKGNIPFVKGSDVTVSWVDEAEEGGNGKTQFTREEMAPKRVIMTTAYTKDLLNQSSIDVERMLMNKMILAHAQAIEEAAICGSGVKQPKGILNTAGIGSVVIGENGGVISWDNVVALETAISAKNADLGNLGYLTNAKVRGALKTTEKAEGTARYLMELANELNGYKIAVTNLVPSNLAKGAATNLSSMLFGNFSDLLIGQWGGLDVVVDPYTKKKSAEVEITFNAWHDVALLRSESFAAVKDIKTL